MEARENDERRVDRRWRATTVVVVVFIFAIWSAARRRRAIIVRLLRLLWSFRLLWLFGFTRARARVGRLPWPRRRSRKWRELLLNLQNDALRSRHQGVVETSIEGTVAGHGPTNANHRHD
jgi:hypothetical protein